jgi:hypothetical protein
VGQPSEEGKNDTTGLVTSGLRIFRQSGKGTQKSGSYPAITVTAKGE